MIFYLCLSIVICFIYYIILFIRFVSYRSGSLARVELKSAVVGNTIFGYLATCRLHYYPSTTTTTTTQLLPFFYYHSTATVVDNSMLWEVERTILAPSLTTIIGWGWDCDNKATIAVCPFFDATAREDCGGGGGGGQIHTHNTSNDRFIIRQARKRHVVERVLLMIGFHDTYRSVNFYPLDIQQHCHDLRVTLCRRCLEWIL